MIARSTVTEAVHAALEAADVLVGDAEAPDGGGWQGEPGASAFVPYVVVWPLWSDTDGANDDIHADLTARYGLTAVGISRSQAEQLCDRARAASRTVVVAGHRVWPVTFETQGDVRRDDTHANQPPLFYVPDRIAVRVTA